MVSNTESTNALAKQLPIGYSIQNYTIKAYLNQSYFANCYLVEVPSISGENQQENNTQTPNRQLVLKEYFPYFATRQSDFRLDAGDFQEHLTWGKAHALKKAQFLTQMKSPHVAKVRSYFEANNTVYLVRDYYEGTTLTEWLRDRRLEHLVQKLDLSTDAISDAMLGEVKLSFEDTQKLIYPVIDALGFMHSYRAREFAYSHENISPDNIFLEKTKDGPRALLFDGIGAGAKINPDLLAVGYSPPESYGQYEAYEPSGDVYSLGAILYSLLTGSAPDHAQQRLTVNGNADLDLSGIDADLDDKISQALNPNPTQRYGSALSFLQALQGTGINEVSSFTNEVSETLNPPMPQDPTSYIELSETLESAQVDPALKATEVNTILWSDPSEDMLPLSYGNNAGIKATGIAVNEAGVQKNDTDDVVFDHPDFYQPSGSTQAVNAVQAGELEVVMNPPIGHDAFEPVDADFESAEGTRIELGATTYSYSETVKLSEATNQLTQDQFNQDQLSQTQINQNQVNQGLTAPESFLTQEREIGIEEAKTTLFSFNPVHPMQVEHQAKFGTDIVGSRQQEEALLHHAELLKGSTAFQYIDGKLSNDKSEFTLQEDYTNTVVFDEGLNPNSHVKHSATLAGEALGITNAAPTTAATTALKQTGIKGLSQWPISALTNQQSHTTRERKPVQRRKQTLVEIFKTGFSEENAAEHVGGTTGETSSQTTSINNAVRFRPQLVLRVILMVMLLCALGALLFSLRLQTPSTPFQNGTARASSGPTQNITPNITQAIKYTSSTEPKLAEGAQLTVVPEFVLQHHKQAVRAVAFNPQGNLIASAGDDQQIHLWDSGSESISKTLNPTVGNAFIKDIAFTTDYLASVDTDGMVVLWDIYAGARTKIDLYKHTAALNTVSFSSDATYLAAGAEDGKVLIWEFSDNRFGKMRLIDMSQKAISNLKFHPDNNALLVAVDEGLSVHLWNTQRNREQVIMARNNMSRLNDIQFNSDGSHLALAGLDKESMGVITVWNIETRKLELTLYHPKFRSEGFAIRPESANSVRAITADPNGKWWASAGVDGNIHLWDTSGALMQSITTGQKGIYALDANPLEAGFVAAAADGSVQTWLLQ